MIPNGANLTYTGTWQTALGKTSADVIRGVSTGLLKNSLPVRSFTSDATWATDFGHGLGIAGAPFVVTLHLQVENGLGFGSPNDIIALVRHWVYDTTGYFPITDSLPYAEQTPGRGEIPTGQPAAPPTPPGGGCIAGTSNSLDGKFSISCWFGNLTTKGLTSVGFIALLVLLGFGLLIFARPAAVAGAARRAAA